MEIGIWKLSPLQNTFLHILVLWWDLSTLLWLFSIKFCYNSLPIISIQFHFNSFSLVFPVFVQLITISVSSLVSFHINSFRFRFKVPNKTEWISKTVQSSKKRSFLTSVEMTRWQRRVENPLFNFLFLFLYFFLLSSCENLEQKKVGKYLLTCSRVVLNAQRHFMFSDVFFISNGVVSFSSQKNCGSCRRN